MGIGALVYTARMALIAEENLQAYLHAHRATIEFIEKNDGRWPASWSDLKAIRPESDFTWVAQHLSFDFDADPAQIANQQPDSFTAIVPHQPCFEIDHRIEELIETVKKHQQAD